MSDSDNHVTRRNWLQLLGTAGAATLAGCSRSKGLARAISPSADASSSNRVAAAAAAAACAPTGSDAEGPYYRPGAPSRARIAPANEPGEALEIRGRVLGQSCRPLAGVRLEIWQADAKGRYAMQPGQFRLRGRLMSDARGEWRFHSIKPGNYLDGPGYRPAHVHFKLLLPGFAPLTTQLYFAGDPYLHPKDSCPLDTCNSSDKRRIITLERRGRGGSKRLLGGFDIVLAKL